MANPRRVDLVKFAETPPTHRAEVLAMRGFKRVEARRTTMIQTSQVYEQETLSPIVYFNFSVLSRKPETIAQCNNLNWTVIGGRAESLGTIECSVESRDYNLKGYLVVT